MGPAEAICRFAAPAPAGIGRRHRGARKEVRRRKRQGFCGLPRRPTLAAETGSCGPGTGSRCRLRLTRMVAEGAVSTRSCTKGTARGESAANLRRSDQRKRHRPFSTCRDLIHLIRRKWSGAIIRQPQPPARAHHLWNKCSVLYGLAAPP